MNTQDLHFEKTTRDDDSFTSEGKVTANINYYNLEAGFWEPFVEGFKIEMMCDQAHKNFIVQVNAKENIDINLSVELIEVVYFAFKSWSKLRMEIQESLEKKKFSKLVPGP